MPDAPKPFRFAGFWCIIRGVVFTGDTAVMPPEPRGICPNCEARTGPVGDPCPSDVCRRKDYRFIPTSWYQSAREFAARKHRPLDPLLGRSIDRYLLAGKIGEGGMGAVYLALQRPLNREVALKVISGLEMTQTTIARFEREARAISVLDHPNIVKLYDYGVGALEFRVPYMALEYVKHGRTLRRALAQMRQESGGAPIPGDVVLSVFSQVLHALGTAHMVGIVHRDMKPDNIMLAPVLGNPTFVKVLDFGLAKAVADVSGFDGTVSHTGQFLGTPYYMAPEQAPRRTGQPEVDGRADLYAVGVMLFEVFTGVRPFEGGTPLEVMAKKVDPGYRPLDLAEARGLPRPLKSFLERALAPRPGDRFAGAEEMLAAFQGALSDRRATAVGLALGRPGSSDERPATPPSPADGVAPEPPTQPIGGADLPVPVTTQVRMRRRRFEVGAHAWAAVAAALVATATVAGIWLMAGRGVRPGPGSDAAIPGAAGAPEPVAAASEPAPAPRPTSTPVADSVTVRGPVPEAEPEPGPAPKPPAKPAGLRVRFESEPAGAEVRLGGQSLGKTPFEDVLEAKAGTREFTFRLKGYRDEKVRSEARDGGVVRAVFHRALPPTPPARRPAPKPKPKPRPKPDDYPLL